VQKDVAFSILFEMQIKKIIPEYPNKFLYKIAHYFIMHIISAT